MKLLCCLSVLLVSKVVFAQSPSGLATRDEPAGFSKAFSFFAPLFFPKILQDEYRLKEYICSDTFASIKTTQGDVKAVDAIFTRALALSWNNVYEALLISFVCTIEHRNIGVKIPLLGPLLWLPLTSEFPDEFHRRVKSLPSKLYNDTPGGSFGDRDKLQHFFGSAFLAYTFESRDVAERFGAFVEQGEDMFVVEGALDIRDIRANRQGQNFGTYLLSDGSVRPSSFLGTTEHASMSGYGCIPDGMQNSDLWMEER